MSLIEISMPQEDREGTEASVGRWLKQPGDPVEEHEPVLEINTDKVTVEIAAPASGRLARQLKQAGDPVAPGEVLGYIDTVAMQGTAVMSSDMETAPAVRTKARERDASTTMLAEDLAPSVRRLLKQHGLMAAEVPRLQGTSRISLRDVEAYVESRGKRSVPGPMLPERDLPGLRARRVPHTPMRKSIAAHMTRSVQAAPHVTSVFEADLYAVLRDREERKQQPERGPVPSITAYLIRAAVQAIREVPEVNSRWHEDHLEIFENVTFGVGTALDTGGLVVPVIRDADAMSLDQISAGLRTVTERARSGKLRREDMEGGTFTLSNHGVSGSLLAAPIILPHGQSAILGAGKLQKRVIVCETGGRELFRVRPMMYVTLTVDHRVVDGQQTNGFLTKFVAALERPGV